MVPYYWDLESSNITENQTQPNQRFGLAKGALIAINYYVTLFLHYQIIFSIIEKFKGSISLGIFDQFLTFGIVCMWRNWRVEVAVAARLLNKNNSRTILQSWLLCHFG